MQKRYFMLLRAIKIIFFSSLLAAAVFGRCEAIEGSVRIGVADYLDVGLSNEFFDNTINALKKTFAPRSVEVFNLPAAQLLSQRVVDSFDFVIASSFNLQELPHEKNRIIATRSLLANDGLSAAAAAIALKERNDLTDWQSLKGKKVATTLPNDLSAWLSALHEFKKNGLNPADHFASVDYVQHEFPEIFSALFTRKIDVGFISACRLEQVEKDGLIPPGRIKVLNQRADPATPCKHSTDRYAGLAFVSTGKTSLSDAKKAALAILQLPSYSSMEWQTATDFTSIRNLLRDLEIGPFSYLKENTFSAIVERYKWLFLFLIGTILVLAINEVRLRRKIRIRTMLLDKAAQEKIRLVEQNRLSRERLAAAEHSNVVSHLSALVAHELKQPLSSITNRMSILKLRLNEALNEDEESVDSVEAIEHSLERAKTILDGVRNYARLKPLPHIVCMLDEIVELAIRDLQTDYKEYSKVTLTVSIEKKLCVVGAPTELQLMVLNLLKNAVREAAKIPEGKVFLSLYKVEKYAELVIANDGSSLPDELFESLCSEMAVMESFNGGLGLGVALSRTIAKNHNTGLQFARLNAGGLEVKVKIALGGII